MARTDLNPISVYANDEQLSVLKKAAALEHRSLSNFLLTTGLEKARDMGIRPFGLDEAAGGGDQKKKKKKKKGGKRATTGRK